MFSDASAGSSSRRESYYLNFIHGSRYQHPERGFEVIEGPICGAHWEGAGRIDIGKWKVGLYYQTLSMQDKPLAIILFAVRRHKTLYVVTMRESMDELAKGFALHPEKLKQGFEYRRMTPPDQERYDDDSGRKSWDGEYHSRGSGWTAKRIPILTLAMDGWEFNPACYPSTVYPKADERAAVKFRESGRRQRSDLFHLVSNGKGAYLFYKGQSYFRRDQFIDVRIKDGHGVREERYQWSREPGDTRGKTDKLTLDGKPIDPTFESYILTSH